MKTTPDQPSQATNFNRRQNGPVSLVLCCAVVFFFAQTSPSQAQEDGSPELIAVDIIVVRPVCLAATVIGAALFLISLPVALATHGTDETAEKLVAIPARATFTRRLGDMTSLTNP